MIELKTKKDETVFLSAIKNADKDFYELVDPKLNVYATLKLKDGILKIIENININEDEELSVRLEDLAIELLEKERSGIENNETQEEEYISPFNPDDIRVAAKQFSIRLIADMIDTKDLDLSPDFQRHYVWNSIQKSRLIESLLLRIPLPIFYFAEDKDGRLTIVDGLQRMTTIKEFMNNKFPLRNLEYLDEGVKNRYYKEEKNKRGIDPKYFRWFNMTQLSVNVIDPSSPDNVKYDIFKRINTGGRPLNNQEIRNCLSSQKVRNLLGAMVNLEEFKSATDNSLKPRRMDDQEMALRYILFYDAYKKDPTLINSYDGYMETALDKVVESYKEVPDNTINDIVARFSNAMKNSEYLFGKKYAFRKVRNEHIGKDTYKQLFNKALFEAWSVLLSDIPHEKIKKDFPQDYMLERFANILEQDNLLMFYLSYGTNGKANMIYVFKTIKNLIYENDYNKEL